MTKDPRAKGCPWIVPYLTVKDAAASLDFYERALGFERGAVLKGDDGTIHHAEMKYHDMVIMFGPENAFGKHAQAPISSQKSSPINLYVYVEDVDKAWQQAIEAGGVDVRKPMDMFWGDRTAEIGDPDKYVWTLATNVGEFDEAAFRNRNR